MIKNKYIINYSKAKVDGKYQFNISSGYPEMDKTVCSMLNKEMLKGTALGICEKMIEELDIIIKNKVTNATIPNDDFVCNINFSKIIVEAQKPEISYCFSMHTKDFKEILEKFNAYMLNVYGLVN